MLGYCSALGRDPQTNRNILIYLCKKSVLAASGASVNFHVKNQCPRPGGNKLERLFFKHQRQRLYQGGLLSGLFTGSIIGNTSSWVYQSNLTLDFFFFYKVRAIFVFIIGSISVASVSPRDYLQKYHWVAFPEVVRKLSGKI